MSQIVLLSIIELIGIVCDRACHFPSFSETQDGSRVMIASICGNIDVRHLVFIIYYGETVSAEH